MNSKSMDIKKLIKGNLKSKAGSKEVDSPYAKYNSKGQLSCIACDKYVKSAIVWQAHIKKRSHQENVTKLLENQRKLNDVPKNPPSRNNLKELDKKKPKGILKNVTSYDSSDSDEGEMDVDVVPTISTVEPADQHVKEENSSKTNESENNAITSSGTLPEGFFDDPVADAKARNVEYRDKDEDEWLAFMKEVSAVEVQSQQIIAEDKEESAIVTQIQQTNDQIKCLERVVQLDKKKKGQLEDRKNVKIKEEENDSSDEDFSPVIWRTKNSLI